MWFAKFDISSLEEWAEFSIRDSLLTPFYLLKTILKPFTKRIHFGVGGTSTSRFVYRELLPRSSQSVHFIVSYGQDHFKEISLLGVLERQLVCVEVGEHRNESCPLIAVVKRMILAESEGQACGISDWGCIFLEWAKASVLATHGRL